MSHLERLYWLDAEIRAGRFPHPDSLAEKFGISRRTAFGDARYLRERLHDPARDDPERVRAARPRHA